MNPAPTKGLKVLLVDDSAPVRGHLRAMLTDIQGVCAVDEAGGAQEAIDFIRRQQPDIVVLDIPFSDGNAFDLLSMKKHDQLQTIMMILTNHVAPQFRQACLAEGADYFLDKSIEFQQAVVITEQLAMKATKED